MPEYHQSTEQPYTPDQLFDLVVDVERYPEFVPGYRQVDSRPVGENRMEVRQTVRFGPAPFRFTSVATVQRPHHIAIDAVDGPFSRLSVDWRFAPRQGGTCHVDFRAAYEVGTGPFEPLVRGWFGEMSERILQSFIARAHRIYGTDSHSV